MLKKSKSVFFVGIKGVAMANLAVLLKKMGKTIYGTDIGEVFITDELLKKHNITYNVGFEPGLLKPDVDLIVYSAAHNGINNPLIKEAVKRDIKIISQAELIAEIMKQFEIKIAVSGCHGKTTTSSFIAYSLKYLKAKPSYVVGVPFFSGLQGMDYKGKKYFVVEADEYGINPPHDKTPKFHKLSPDYIVTTNIDFDHPDVYSGIKETKEAYFKFFQNALNGKIKQPFIFRGDDKNLMDVAGKLPKNSYITCGFDSKSDFQITNPQTDHDFSYFELADQKNKINLGKFKITLSGKMNIGNAAQVVVLLYTLGFKTERIKESIEGFTGSERRFEKIYEKNDIFLFDDYAHHPSEIQTSVNAAREKFPHGRIVVMFQPHTFTRTASLIDGFAESLSLPDLTLLMPIFASAREDVTKFNITSFDIAEKGDKDKITAYKTKNDILNALKKIIRPGDILFTMGAGDIYKLKDEIINIINEMNQDLKIEKNKDLYLYLTLKTHVVAQYFMEAKNRSDLIFAKIFSLEKRLPFLMLGGGSNLAIIKKEIPGIVVKNNYQSYRILEEDDFSAVISVSSGYPVSLLIAKTITRGLSGFEYHQGLPGTVGGAIYMNSKWTKPTVYFGDDLLYAYLIDKNGKVKKVEKEYFRFAYDYSVLQNTGETVLEAVFKLKKSTPESLKQKAAWALSYRKQTQPFGIASSGCFFRNISKDEMVRLKLPTTSAGYLIDKSGLKGYELGGFFVSPIHANFIINRKDGKQEDLVKLLRLIKDKVKQKFGVKLKEEVIVI